MLLVLGPPRSADMPTWEAQSSSPDRKAGKLSKEMNCHHSAIKTESCPMYVLPLILLQDLLLTTIGQGRGQSLLDGLNIWSDNALTCLL